MCAVVSSELFDYDLPLALIAQQPAPTREEARLMVLRPHGIEHRTICDLVELLPQGGLVVLNQTRVRKARLMAKRSQTGGRAELLLLKAGKPEGVWTALGKARRPLAAGDRLTAGEIAIEVLDKSASGALTLRLSSTLPQEEALLKEGQLPLPPYVRREPNAVDEQRYQTVFARQLGSVAAPTASLHLSREMLEALERRGSELGFLTLHVGVATFRPITSERLEDHVMHSETLDVPERLVQQVERARRERRPVIAVGTTVVRALEAAANHEEPGKIRCFSGETDLFIRPGFRFRVVDALLTNFHMPKSTLLALVAAFTGYDLMRTGYESAIEHEYRFLSYGDAMWIPERYGDRA